MESAYRATCRRQVTKLINTATNLLNDNDTDTDEFVVMLARLKSAKETLSMANREVTVNGQDAETEYETRLEYDDKAVTTMAKLERRIEKSKTIASIPQRIAQDHGNNEIVRQKSTVRLPKLELKHFNGDISAWPSFWEQFRTVVHENKELDAITKFNYLQSVLVGKAAATISGLTPTAACYNDSIEMLKSEYGNNDRIIDSYVHKLNSLNAVKNKNEIWAIRNLYNTVSSIMRTFNALSVPIKEYGMMLKSCLLRTIPFQMKVDFFRIYNNESHSVVVNSRPEINIGENESTPERAIDSNGNEILINKLMFFLKTEIESIERAKDINLPICASDSKIVDTSKFEKGDKNKHCTAAGLLTGVSNKCLFCNSTTHELQKCDGPQSLQERKIILKKNARCFRCTKANHTSRQCRNNFIKCNKCKGRHATSMCDPNFIKSNNSNNTSTPAQIQLNSCNPNSSTSLLTNGRFQNVWLQTACAFISNSDYFRMKDSLIRFVIDGGAQLTFIKEDISRKFNLPIIGTHKISINSSGSKKGAPARLCNRVSLNLRSLYNDNIISISAIEIPQICLDTLLTPTTADFCNRNVSKSFNLADARIEGIEPIEGISMLVGADNYWALVTGETEKISERLTAVNTKFGWTLHGPASIDSFDVNQNIVTLLHATMLENEDESNESIDIKKFWDLETLGIRDNEEISNEFTQHFSKNNIVMRRNRYEVSLPWKNPNINLDHNFPGALARVKSLTSKLIRNSALFEYDSAVREYIKSGCAEMIGDVSVSSMDFPKNITHLYFMPHRPVYREDKTTTKLRVVFDASAHAPGFASLNELLNPVIKHHLSIQPEKYKVTCETLDNSFYVDDLVVALKTPNEAEQIYKESTQIMLGAAMKLRKWCSNDEILRNMFEKDNVAEISNIRKVLGIQWHINSDELSIDINAVLDLVKSPGTKRNVLKMVSKIYDPMGFIGPFGLRMKILLQSIWKLELGWDELLPGDILEMWIAWSREIFVLQDFVVPRCVVAFPHDNLQLHIFADASPRAYGAVAYIRCSFGSQITVNLLMAKNRVAPIKQSSNDSLTLPKLELTASLCASRLSKYIEEKLSIVTNQIFIWSDSKIALYWIRGDPSRWKPYVANRVNQIRELSDISMWRHCPGVDNPADLLTRGVKAKILIESTLWKNGPCWLTQEIDFWPNEIKTLTASSIPCYFEIFE
ncbi:hypothetical protein JTB14_018603 [Gonioctena quinquepunctata]|nr:hypothetical protein JTB14_018603 [Gonioctena quinquepunctata]